MFLDNISLKHRDIVGIVTSGRLGLRNLQQSTWRAASTRERSTMVEKEVRQTEEERRQAQPVGMRQQGAWTSWESARSRQLKWNNIWKMDGYRISVLLRSVYDVLPSPMNLKIWGLIEDPSFKLCGKPANLEHVLSACSVALAEGMYTWRHDQVLREITASLHVARKKKRQQKKGPIFINFVQPSE